MVTGSGRGFGSLTDIGRPQSEMRRAPSFNAAPASTSVQSQTPASKPASTMPYGQANDPGAYGTPGAPGKSPLGEWQSWLNSMGPYLAQMPTSQPNAESGGLSSLSPSPTGFGLSGYYGAQVEPSWGRRGFQELR